MKRLTATLSATLDAGSFRSSKTIWILTLLLGALLVLGACTTNDDGTDDEQSDAGVEDEAGDAGEIGALLALLEELGVPFVVPEIAILRDWADRSGTMVQLEDPRGQLELYQFDSATGLNDFVTRARAGSVRDLPANAAAWTFGRVLVVLPGAAELPAVATLLNSALPTEGFPLDPDATIVDSGTDAAGAGGLDDGTTPPTLVAGTDTVATRAGLGTYCWSGAEVGICADSIGIISGVGTLPIAGGESVTLSGDLAGVVIETVTARAWPLSEVELIEQGNDFVAWSPQGTALAIAVVVDDEGFVLTPGLPQGDYLVSVRVLADRGDAQYGILLKVDGGSGFELVDIGGSDGDEEVDGDSADDGSGGDSGAEPSEEPAPPSTGIVLAAFDQPFRLASGGVANVGGQVSLVFAGVQADNRCPSDVTCVIAGAASVVIELVDGNTASQTIVDVPPTGGAAFSAQGFDGLVMAVDPEAHSERPILPNDYVVTIVISAPAGSGGDDSSGGDTGDDAGEPEPSFRQVNTLAPIENVQVNIAESFPVQVFVVVSSGLPSGCAEFDRIDVERMDSIQINLTVWNLVPAPDELIACTAIYGITENTVALGSEFESGVEQVVVVNGVVGVAFTP
jgi:hypothetical protein